MNTKKFNILRTVTVVVCLLCGMNVIAQTKLVTPSISETAAEDKSYKTITINSNVEGSTVYYTIDMTDPNESATRIMYTEPFRIDHNLTIRAINTKADYLNSNIAERVVTGIDSRFRQGGIYYRRIDNNVALEVEVTSGDLDYSGVIVIPDNVTNNLVTYKVVSIGNSAFYDQDKITSVKLSNTIETIGNSAFYSCNALETVSMSNQLREIGNSSFKGCNTLKEIEYPASLRKIGSEAFYDCDKITDITLNNGLESLGSGVFRDMNELRTVTIPSTLNIIPSQAFSGCGNLKKVIFSEGLEKIDESAFSGCRSITSITLPNSVTALGVSCFESCSGLLSIKLPSQLTELKYQTFYNCSSLGSIEIPASVQTLGMSAFSRCSQLSTVTIPEGVSEIPSYCFYECTSLTGISLPSTLTLINRESFLRCYNLASISLPKNLTTIYYNAFVDCNSLASVYSYASTPPIMPDNNAFLSAITNAGAVLYVTSEDLFTYQNTPKWQDFTSINAIGNALCEQPIFQLDNYSLRISTPTAGAAIWFTDDGSNPVTSDTRKQYSSPIDFLHNDTILAIAVKEGMDNSQQSSFIMNKFMVARPEIKYSFAGGTLSIDCDKPDSRIADARIYYSISYDSPYDPAEYSNEKEIQQYYALYTEPLTITRPGRIKVRALRDGWLMSETSYLNFHSDYYQDAPTIGWNKDEKTVTINHGDVAATIYYTLDGTDPNTSDTRMEYTESFTIDRNLVIKAIVEKEGHYSSVIREYSVTDVNSTFYVAADGLYYRIVDNNVENYVEVTKGDLPYSGDIVIPETATNADITYRVTRIGNNTFSGNRQITSVTLPKSIVSIGKNAFYRCYALGTVNLPNSLVEIESGAFYECTSFTDIKIPESVRTIGSDAFRGCSSVTSLTIAEGLESMGSNVFRGMRSIRSVTIPSTLKVLGYGAFAECRNLIQINLPQGLERIEGSAFYRCYALETIDLPNSINFLGDYCFQECTRLISVKLPTSLEAISPYTFLNCTSLSSVDIPANVQTIGYRAFEKCSKLASVSLPEGITMIPDNCFLGCSSLASVSLPSTLNYIAWCAFSGCVSLANITLPASLETMDRDVFEDCNALSSIVVMANNPPVLTGNNPFLAPIQNAKCVLQVNADAVNTYKKTQNWQDFADILPLGQTPCSQPTFVIDNYVLSISTGTDGAEIWYTVDGSNPESSDTRLKYSEPFNFLHNDTVLAVAVKDGMANSPQASFVVNQLRVATPIITYSFTEGKLSIDCAKPDSRFEDARIYYSINFDTGNSPYSYRTEAEVLNNCKLYSGPMEILRPGQIWVVAVRNGWIMSESASLNFYSDYCQDQPYINWNRDSRTITITHNDAAAKIIYTLDGTDPNTSDTRMDYSEPFTIDRNLVVQAIVEKEGYYSSLTRVYEVKDVNSTFYLASDGLYYRIVDNTVENFVEVTNGDLPYSGDIVIPETATNAGVTYRVTRIGNYTFYENRQITSVTLPKSIVSIGKNAFYRCYALGTVNLPNSLVEIESGAFYECTSFTDIKIPESVRTIGSDAFRGCSSVTSLTIAEGLESMGSNVFRGMRSIRSVTIPSTLKVLGYGAFAECRNLIQINLPQGLERIEGSAFYRCYALETIDLPNSINFLGDYCFQECTRLISVKLPTSLEAISPYTFLNCTSLSSVDIPANVQTIGYRAFEKCSKLASVSLPEGITMIPDNCFLGCSSLASVSLPSTLNYIAWCAFSGCVSLANITLPASLETMDRDVFEDCNALSSIVVMANNPPVLTGNNPFLAPIQNAKCVLQVNADAVNTYKKTQNWQDFADILPLGQTPCSQPTFVIDNYVLSISTGTDGAEIWYTVDGSNPESSDTRLKYSEPFNFLHNDTVLAVAVKDGMANSPQASFVVNQLRVATPIITYSFTEGKLSIDCAKPDSRFEDARIYYSINFDTGNSPYSYRTEAEVLNNCKLYSGPMEILRPGQIWVVAVRTGWVMSEAASLNFYSYYYQDKPTIRWDKETQTITIIHNDADATIYYTIDNSDPNTSSTRKVYTEPFQLERNLTVRAIVEKDGKYSSLITENVVNSIDNSFEYEGIRYKLIDNSLEIEVEVTSSSVSDGYSGVITIPETVPYNDVIHKVTRIGERAFFEDRNLTNVIMPSSIKSIGKSAFAGIYLTTIKLPNSIETIEYDAFGGCPNLTEMVIPDGVKAIGEYMFNVCKNLISVKLPSSLTEIPEKAFNGCWKLVSVNIPGNVNKLGNGAFYECKSLTSIAIPEGVTDIPENCFENCYALETVSLPSTLNTVQKWAFNHCQSLTTLSLPAGVKEIQYRAFQDCPSLTSLYVYSETVPVIVTSSNENPFKDIVETAVLYVPTGSAMNDYKAAEYWTEFVNIEVATEQTCAKPTFVMSNYSLAMATATKGASIYYTIDGSDPTVHSLLYKDTLDFIKNDTVRAIAVKDGYANSQISEFRVSDFKVLNPTINFNFEKKIITIDCPTPDERIQNAQIYYRIFNETSYGSTYSKIDEIKRNCVLYSDTISVTRPGIIYAVAVRDGWIRSDWQNVDYFSVYYQTQPTISWDSESRTITIKHGDQDATIYYTLDGSDPNTSETRKAYSMPFTINRNLTINAIVEKEGKFSSLTSKYSVTDVNSRFQKDGVYYRIIDNVVEDYVEVTSGDNGFSYSGVITIPETVSNGGVDYTVTRIGNSAFSSQDKVTKIVYPTTVTSIGSYAFYQCHGINEFEISANITEVGDNAFNYCTQLQNLQFNEGLLRIGSGSFANCSNLQSVILPSTLESIGNSSFSSCNNLKDVQMCNGLKAIGSSAFYNCTALLRLDIPNSVTALGSSAFSGCRSLTSIHLPDDIQVLEHDLFYNCSNLQSITIPASVTNLEDGVFRNNSSLEGISIPDGITVIPAYAFYDCSSLVSVNMPESVAEIGYAAFQGCNKMQSLVLPGKLNRIADYAFNGCSMISDVYSLTALPPVVENYTWNNVTLNATLHVISDDALAAYEQAAHWADFKGIDTFDGVIPCWQPTFLFSNYRLTIATQTPGASIYYTDDDSDPAESATRKLYADTINFWKNDTIRAIAVKDGMGNSPVGQFMRNDFKVANPVISINDDDLVITIDVEQPVPVKNEIYYVRYDGNSWPNTYSNADEIRSNCILYEGEFRPQKPGRLSAIVLRDGWIASEWVSFDYYNNYNIAQPIIGSKESARAVVISNGDKESKIYYTLDGTDPAGERGILYKDTIRLSENCIVRAVAVKDKHFNSEECQGTFNWFRVAKPEISVSAITATIKCDLPCDTIFYTVSYGSDDSIPSRKSNVYTEPIKLTGNCYIRAIGVHKNWSDSETASYYYNAREHTCSTPNITQNKSDSTLTITSTEGASIYYTLDGTVPTAESQLYTGPVKIERNDTVRAIAMREDMITSGIGQHIIDWVTLHDPIIEFSGIYCIIRQDKPGSTIYYTVDETDPTSSVTRKVYTGQFALSEMTKVSAYAVLDRYISSKVVSRTFDPSGKNVEKPAIARIPLTDSIQIGTSTEDAVIYYTTNGMNPTRNDFNYREPIVVSYNQTIKAFAIKEGLYDSEIETFSVDWFTVPRPVITVDGMFVTISCAKENARIYYTLNGTEPTTEDNLYSDTLTMSKTCTIKAKAFYDNFNSSQTATVSYSVADNTCGTPVIKRLGSTDFVSMESTPTDGTEIYYTVDGTTPTKGSLIYTGNMEMTGNCKLKAYAVNPKLFDSQTAEFTVNWFTVVDPVITVDGVYVDMACAKEGAKIYYTLNGKAPTVNDNLYKGRLTMTTSCTIKAMAVLENYNNSSVVTVSYSMDANTCGTPVIKRLGSTDFVTIESQPSDGTTIYYTLDGSVPSTTSSKYSGNVELTENCTLKAIAVNSKLFQSSVASLDVDWFKVATPKFSYSYKEALLTIEDATDNSTIYYAFDEDPTTQSAVYSEPLLLTDNRSVHVLAVRKNYHNSDIVVYTPDAFVCTDVTFSYDGLNLTMLSNEGASIYYTLDGSKPTDKSLLYTAPVQIESLCTVRAVSMKKDFIDSEIKDYTISYLYDGENVSTAEAGHLKEVFQWVDGGSSAVSGFPVKGSINYEDLTFIKSLRSLEHLDLSEAHIEGGVIPDNAFAGMDIVSFISPKEQVTVGDNIFKGCNKIAAVVWNMNSVVPESVIEDIDNPNLLLYVNSSIYAPNGYKGNLISGGTADEIVLTDTVTGGNFYCPQRFYAKKVRYTHDYSQPTEMGQARGWETISLPFDVETITHETRGALAPFAKGEDKEFFKPFWLYELSSTGFTRAAQIKAYTPYIISMPNNPLYADDFILSGKVTFESAEIYIEADNPHCVEKGAISFEPSLRRQAKSDNIMTINLEDYTDNKGNYYVNGSAFIANMRESNPFEACAVIESGAPSAVYIRSMFDGISTDIHAAEIDNIRFFGDKHGVFDLNGRKLSDDPDYRPSGEFAPSILIINGKKTVVK